jgi:hypothetical protein
MPPAPGAAYFFGGVPLVAAAPIAKRAPRGARDSHRCFTCLEDERLMRVMQHHPNPGDLNDWETIAKEMGCGFAARQLQDRWYYYLRPGISRAEFSAAERRECLRLAVTETCNWVSVAARLGCERVRTCAQVKSVAGTLLARLTRFQITVQHPDDVDAIPEEFFEKVVPNDRGPFIRDQFMRTRIAVLQNELRAQEAVEQ